MTAISSQGRRGGAPQEVRERRDPLWQQAPVGILEATPGGVITFANDAVAAMLGRSPESLVGTSGAALADPAYADMTAPTLARLRAGKGYVAERRYLSSDGRSVPVHVSTAVLRDERGEVSSIAAFVVDLTEMTEQRAAVSAALGDAAETRDQAARRQAFTDALLETVDVGIVSCDASGNVLVRNRAERDMIGLGDEPANDRAPSVDLLDASGEPVEPVDYPLARALRGELLEGEDARIGPVGGPYRDVVMRANRITTPDRRPLGAVVALTDVTAERTTSRLLALQHDRLSEAQRLGQLGSFAFDVATGEFEFSDETYRIWGVPVGADLASLRLQLMHPDDVQRVISRWTAALARGGQDTTEYRIVRPDGSLRHLRVTTEVVLDASGEAVSLHGTHLDVTEVTSAQREAVEASKHFQAILTATPDYTFITDVRTGAVVYGSPGKTVLGISTDELERLGPAIIATLVHPDEQPRLKAANQAARELADGEVLNLRYQARNVDGKYHWLTRRVTPFRRDPLTGAVIEVMGVVRDVTDVVEAEERLTYTALHDPLTGLPNRALLMDRLEVALGRTLQSGHEVAVLFCDLDGFKRVNDTAGHAAGDRVLIETADRLRSVLRHGDTVARVGGDEFVMIVEPWNRDTQSHDAGDADVDSRRGMAATLAERIIEVMRTPFTVNGVDHVVTVSVGLTSAGPGAATATPLTADGVLQDADAAMYRAKNGGKDRAETFEHGLRTDMAERGRVERVLRRALATVGGAGDAGAGAEPADAGSVAPTLTAAYQPIVDGDTGALVGFEALARLTDEHRLPIAPDVFVGVAENSTLIRPLGRVMLRLACEQLAAWRRGTPAMGAVTMAVNVSALEAQHASWPDQVRRTLHDHGLVGSDLVLEITETALLHAANSTITALRELHEEGVGIALDDFGVGYASLRYLATLPVSAVKIDRSFTAGLPHDHTSRKIVAAVAGLAAELDMSCVVEGVETPGQRGSLPEGVQVQGYLTGRPMAASRLDVRSLTGSAPAKR